MNLISSLLEDGLRMFRYFFDCIRDHPLQIYVAAPVFSPSSSPSSASFRHEWPEWLAKMPRNPDHWDDLGQVIIPWGDIQCIDVSSSGHIALGGKRCLHIWDGTTGQHLQSLRNSEVKGNIAEVAISSDSKRVASFCVKAGTIGTLHLWHLPYGECQTIAHISGTVEHRSLRCFSPDGLRLLVIAGFEKGARLPEERVYIWRINPRQKKVSSPWSCPVSSNEMPFLPLLACNSSSSLDDSVTNDRNGDLENERLVEQWKLTISGVQEIVQGNSMDLLTFSSDCTWLAYQSHDIHVCRLDRGQVRPATKIPCLESPWIHCLTFSESATQLAVWSSYDISIFDTKSGQLLRILPLRLQEYNSLWHWLAFFDHDRHIVGWDLVSGCIELWDIATTPLMSGRKEATTCRPLQFSPDQAFLVPKTLATLQVVCTETGDNVLNIPNPGGGFRGPGIPSMTRGTFKGSPTTPQRTLLAVGSGRTLRIWDLLIGMCLAELYFRKPDTSRDDTLQGDILASAFSSDGTRIITISSFDHCLTRPLITGHKECHRTPWPDLPPLLEDEFLSDVSFTPDDEGILLLTTRQKLLVLNSSSGKLVQRLDIPGTSEFPRFIHSRRGLDVAIVTDEPMVQAAQRFSINGKELQKIRYTPTATEVCCGSSPHRKKPASSCSCRVPIRWDCVWHEGKRRSFLSNISSKSDARCIGLEYGWSNDAGAWISLNGHPVLWVPLRYREPVIEGAGKKKIVLGNTVESMIFLTLSDRYLSKLE